MKSLLNDYRVDPTSVWNSAIRSAAFEGHLEVVKLLLADPRVDPNALGSYALNWACSRGHIEIVREIIKVRKINDFYKETYIVIF